MTSNTPHVFIQNPHHSYGPEYVRIFAQEYGLTSVCNYTDARDAKIHVPLYPVLLSDCVAANLTSLTRNVESLVRYLHDNFNIVAAVPHNEVVLADTTRVNEEFTLDWVPHETLSRFRNKQALKEFVRQWDASLDISPSVVVRTCQEVRAAMDTYGFKKVVLKPNDGWGNRGVGFFDSTASNEEISAFLAVGGDSGVLLEEFFGGREFYVCGQVDAGGNVTNYAVFETIKGSANGLSNLDFEVRLTRTSDPAFASLMEFSAGVVRASGLTRSPFHVDLKFDEGESRLIEMGARMVGDSRAYDLNHVHGNSLNVFEVSAHYYVRSDDYGAIDLDWDRYDSLAFRSIQGVNTKTQRLYSFAGAKQVEALPQFVRWANKPHRGSVLPVTTDLLSTPWQLTIEGSTEAGLDEVASDIRSQLKINEVSNPITRIWLKLLGKVPGIARQVKLRTSRLALTPVPINEPAPAVLASSDADR